MRVAMLTGGGDCPGLNAVMRAVTRKGERVYGDELVGLRDGWRGAVDGDLVELSVQSFRGTLPRGGTILGSSRTNPYKIDGGPEAVKATLADHGIDALVAIGGEDTLRLARRIATWAAIAGGATMVLVPERAFDIDEVCQTIQRRHEGGRYASIIVVAEGAEPASGTLAVASGEVDAFGHARLGGIGDQLARIIEERTGYETRAIVLGHVQRGGTPTAFDRVLATRYGIAAIDAVHDGDFGKMTALRAGEIVRVPLNQAVGELKTVDPDLFHGVAEPFFG